MDTRTLGTSGLRVSRLSLGSWRTFERIPREAGAAVLRTAREAGITFLDDARYDDETGMAPLATGWSEVVFGELFRTVGWPRDEVVVANKLWWEFWPQESAAAELDGSLTRMGFDTIDLAYSAPLPDGLTVEEAVADVGGLIAAGKLRAWGTLNWPGASLTEAVAAARDQGVPPPCATQLPYNLLHRGTVESPAMGAALEAGPVAVVASAVLAGGALTGKYATGLAPTPDPAADPDAHRGSLADRIDDPRPAPAPDPGPDAHRGRLADRIDDPRLAPALAAARELSRMAADHGTTPAALALAFALAHPTVASALFGATSPAQVTADVAAVDLAAGLTPDAWSALRAIGSPGPGA